jgi:hypothetical protein
VATAEEAWRLASLLRAEGFVYDEKELPWFKIDANSRRPYGQVPVLMRENGVPARVDIHFGGYSVRHCGLVRLDLRADRVGLQPLPTTDNLALVIANAAGDYFITMKDLNDLHLCLARNDVDWTRLVATLHSVAIYGAFWSMLTQLRRFFVMEPSVDAVMAAFPRPRVREPLPSLTKRRLRTRCLVVTRSAWHVQRQHSWWRAVRAAASAAWYYTVPLHPRVAKIPTPRLRLTARRLNNWSCIRLVPPDLLRRLMGKRTGVVQDASGDHIVFELGPLSVRRTRTGDLVRVAHEWFVPTISGRLSIATVSAGLARTDHVDGSVITKSRTPDGVDTI